MRTRILLVVIAITAAFATSASQADAFNPCTPENTAVLFDAAVGARGNQGEATGIQKIDGVWTFLRCEMTLDPKTWAADTPAERCTVKAHELVHLIRGDDEHTADGLMAHVPGWYGPCHTLRERVRHDIEAKVPLGAQVACGKWQNGHRAFTCIVDYATADGQSRMRAYRVRTRGDAYAIRRIAGPAWLRLSHP